MDTIRDIVQAFELNIISTSPARQYITARVKRQLTNVAASKDTVGDVVKAVQLDLLDITLARNYANELLLNRHLEAVQTPSTSSDNAEFQVQMKDGERARVSRGTQEMVE